MNEARQRLIEQAGLPGSGKLVENWQRLLENVGDDKTAHGKRVRGVVARLYQNQYEWLTRGNGMQSLVEDTNTSNAGIIATVMFPLIKAVWRNMIGHEVCSVQPIHEPRGTIFTRQRIYQNSKGRTAAGTEMVNNLDYQYASEYVSDETLATGDGVQYGGGGAALTVALQYKPVRSLSAADGYAVIITEEDATSGAVLQTATDNAAGGFTFSPTGAFVGGAIDYQTGVVTNFSFQNTPVAGNPIQANYQWIMEGSSQIPEIFENIQDRGVRTQPRKLKYRWTTEAADDLQAVHGLDVRQMLTSDAAREITLEIDRDILMRMWAAGATRVRTFDFTVPPGISEIDYIRGIVTRMSDVSALIQQQSGFAPANFFVTDPQVAARINQTRSHGDLRGMWTQGGGPQEPFTGDVAMAAYTSQVAQAGIMRMGLTNYQWVGYTDAAFSSSTMTNGHYIMLGLKGQEFWDAGVVYVPYVPLEIMRDRYSPENDTTVMLVRTRDKIVTVRDEYYGRVRVTGGL